MSRLRVTYLVFFLSGFAGLGYQIVWTRAFAMGLGHEMPALLAVVGAFFAGLALGAWLLDKTVSRTSRPGAWYAGLEIIAALWSLMTIPLISWANNWLSQLLGPTPDPWLHWLAAFSLPFLILLPCTMAMGATLPAVDRFVTRLGKTGAAMPGLYALNTAGAAIGILLSIFVFLPTIGFKSSIILLAICDILCAILILYGPAKGEHTVPLKKTAPSKPSSQSKQGPSLSKKRILITLFFTGFLGIAYEIIGVRVMIQVLENTIYSYASVLFIYLFGTSVGAAFYQRWLTSTRRPVEVLSRLLITLSLCCSLGILFLSLSDTLYRKFLSIYGDSLTGAIFAEMTLATCVFLLPTIIMGMVFSHLAQNARQADRGVGQALAINTFGGAIAPIFFGVFMIPYFGTKMALVVVSLSYLWLTPQVKRSSPLIASTIVALATFFLDMRLVNPPKGGKIEAYSEGIMATVAVVSSKNDAKFLKVNDRFVMGGSGGHGAGFAERRMASIPLLLHPNPKKALFLGLGPGITFGTVAQHPGVQGEGVELVPEAVKFLPHFAPQNNSPTKHPNLEVFIADARRYVRTAQGPYDVIVADLFQPARDGAGALYTVEHFAAIKALLKHPKTQHNTQGLFCQWLPLYQIDLATLRLITRSFLSVFPEGYATIASYNADTLAVGLIGGHTAVPHAFSFQSKRAQDPQLAKLLNQILLRDPLEFTGTFLAGNQKLKAFAGDGPLNTDDRPLVTWQAPILVYSKKNRETPSDRSLSLLNELSKIGPPDTELIYPETTDQNTTTQINYLKARNLYLQGYTATLKNQPERAEKLYLESTKASPDFRASYFTLMSIARNLADSNPSRSIKILQSLVEANPSIPDAKYNLQEMLKLHR